MRRERRRATVPAAIALIAAGLGAGAACKRQEPASAASAAGDQPAGAGGARSPNADAPAPLASAPFYRLDAGPQTPCAAGTTCEVRLVLTALGSYKVNQEYPFKFVADPMPGLLVEGKGSFAFDDATSGTLTVKFRAAKPGPARLSGTFKLSVCSADVCEIEQPKVELELPVS